MPKDPVPNARDQFLLVADAPSQRARPVPPRRTLPSAYDQVAQFLLAANAVSNARDQTLQSFPLGFTLRVPSLPPNWPFFRTARHETAPPPHNGFCRHEHSCCSLLSFVRFYSSRDSPLSPQAPSFRRDNKATNLAISLLTTREPASYVRVSARKRSSLFIGPTSRACERSIRWDTRLLVIGWPCGSSRVWTTAGV